MLFKHFERPEVSEEGRLPEILEDDFTLDNIGIDPRDKVNENQIKIETKIELTWKNLDK